MNVRSTTLRRAAALIAAATLAVGGLAAAVATLPDHSRAGKLSEAAKLAALCEEVIFSTVPGTPDSCAHADEAPAGVDVNKHVSTAELESRDGAAAAAVDAAQDEGVPVASQLAVVSDRVPCDGDGTSGYRVQAIYVVTADKPNRYASVSDQIKQWAAGVNTVFNLSAAKTGGVRNLRYVTAPNGDGTCSPTVLNVTVPAGSFASFGASITAMQNVGYTSPARKYLMWVDGTGQCGIAQTYMASTPGQDNPNNGTYPQFARIDTACWGQSASVEAHELSHTFGSVQNDAPHTTKAGHCFDDADRMCYTDSSGKAMQQLCPADQETLFDCNNDDYYSTFPPAGSYLATHWNTASSRFLIGGGDGVGGGSLGVPTKLGGTMSVNNPALPGLPTQASVNLEVPSGRTTSVAWTSLRKDCVFANPGAVQTTVTCDAKTTTATTVTATVTDSTGEKLVRTSALTFSTTPRSALPSMNLDGSDAASYTACPSGKGVLTATVVDQASGVAVKGLTVAWFRKVGTAIPVQVATSATNADGVATSTATAMTAGTYSAKTTATTAFPTVTTGTVDVTVATGTCSTALSSSVDDTSTEAGDPVTISGALTRTLPGGGAATPAAGERVAIYSKAATATTWSVATTVTTAADGTYAATIKPLGSLTLQARFLAHTGFAAASAAETPVTVATRTTVLTVSPSASEVMAAASVTVTGTLTQSAGSGTAPMTSTPVQVTYPLAGGKTATLSAITNASGGYSVVVKPTGSGTVTTKYAGKTGWAPATADQTLTVNEWATGLTVTPSATSMMAGAPVTVTGTLTQTGTSGATPMPSTQVQVTYPLAGGKTATANATTNASGVYTVIVKPTGSGTMTVKYAGKPGWAATTTDQALTVNEWASSLTMTATRNASTGYVSVTGTLKVTDTAGVATPKASSVITVTYQLAADRTATLNGTTNAAGVFTVSVKPGVGGQVLARYAGVPGWSAATATPVTITF